jgi:hypothetical protein
MPPRVTVTIAIEGDPGYVGELLRRVADAIGAGSSGDTDRPASPSVEHSAGSSSEAGAVTVPATPSETADIADEWSTDEIRLWFRSLSQQAQRIVAEIATRPKGYPFDELFQAVDLSGQAVGGRLSSIGWTKWRLRLGGKPDLLRSDSRMRLYSLDPAAAAVIRELAEERP